MAFIKKTWLARLGVGLNRFRMNNSTDVVLESNPISVTQQGDQLSADNMNNLETRIGNAFDEMAGNLATIEVSPSQHNWTVGSQIVYNGILYKVTSAISTDDNLVVGTNIEPYPVSSAISDIIAYEDITCSMIGGGRWLYGRISDYTNRKLVSVFLLSKLEDSIATFLDYSINTSAVEDGSFSIRTGNSTATTGLKVRALTIRK